MNIGIISDIHGDYPALIKVLDYLDEVHQVAHILCAGDLVGRGPKPDSVVQVIRERGIPTVRGNHDEWSYNLSPENKIFLETLPMDWRGQIGGRSIFMCHGKPGNNLWGLYRDNTSNTLLNMMLASLRSEVLIAGHTHIPMYIRVEQGCVINPGSLYTINSMRPTSHTYGILNLNDLSFRLYDVNNGPDEFVEYAG